ncbi:hypothetical protein P280DRAFT_474469 [Massarina eburnea CBS 473.64]|uniref:F-box domain-containing protein n=1 Tax=Massarina eburnea CBS 473.64 TaxID=1395130 RepID=A0A6A6RJR2_9PLEO|nr:hypothetical protein P280DRAFT_474469 [Massarina eburnea CBS 473.64]
MACFGDLSVDLLYVIFAHVQVNKRLLNNIALSCRLFREVAQQFFVRDVTITHSPTCSRTKLFLRTLEARPDLVPHVHRLELDLLREDIHWPEEQNNIKRITSLLTNLREFRFSSRDYKIWHYEITFPLRLTSENAHTLIRKIEWCHNITFKTLYHCMSFPRIESLYCRELHGTPEELGNPDQISKRFSSLQELHIGSSMSLPAGSFQHILGMPQKLRRLRIDFHDAYGNNVKADEIAALLEPVEQTLEELTITKPKGPLISAGLVNLSGFASLKKLALPFKFLFPQARLQSTLEVDTILPPRLNELKLYFVAITLEVGSVSIEDNYRNVFTWVGEVTSILHNGGPRAPNTRMPELQNVILEKAKVGGYPGDLSEVTVETIMKFWKDREDDGDSRVAVRYQVE